MRALILGMDGYLGWSLACALSDRGHEIYGVDNGSRRRLVKESGGTSATKILMYEDRVGELRRLSKGGVYRETFDISHDFDCLSAIMKGFKPEVIYHLAQMPSAPFSMKDRKHCLWTHQNNLFSTLNVLYAMRDQSRTAHLIKIGTMGEFGQPNVPIPEGEVLVEIDGHRDMLPFPRAAGSWYHQTKVHDTHNIRMACKIWGLRCTDVMQGVVYGNKIKEMYEKPELNTRLDFDQYFGTVINRFIVQAVLDHPLTIYGRGTQVRSILPLQDSINCLGLIALSPPAPGMYRELNQFQEYKSISEMAHIVQEAYYELTGSEPKVLHYENPRQEKEEHFYKPMREILPTMGYAPSERIEQVVRGMIADVIENKLFLSKYKKAIIPTAHWSGDKRAIQELRN